ncbi:MAG: Gfo/Idh/MocA family oxidoreductase [Planctomycetes bacterium]|nr:Gfo/Idh/MocA family oxidoreductase [Planctomycetota bacterium]
MTQGENNGMTRREVMKKTGKLVSAAAVIGAVSPGGVYAAGNDTIQIALVGCGGRGGGAIVNALSTKGPTKLVAMADVFDDKLNASYKNLIKKYEKQMDVPKERQFVSFDGYKQAMDCLKPGDVVILATPPAFRWVHFKYAIEKGLHVFMEKPITVDGPSSRKMFALGEEAEKKGLKVGVGLMCRHCKARGELYDRVKSGEIGDITMLRAYRMQGPIGSCFSPKNTDPKMSEVLYQIRRFHSFLWASGGAYSDFLIHNIDECCWIKDAWPVKARASGGRHYRGDAIDQNFDSYSVEYTFADGTKMFLEGRNMNGCQQEFASYAHGTKGCAVISTSSHHPAGCRTYRGQDFLQKDQLWHFPGEEPNPYQLEWDHLMTAIRENTPYNEVKRGTEASLVTSMGRMAAHTGQVITRDDILNSEHEFAPDVDKLTMTGPAPLQLDTSGKYPIPQPGLKKKREF